MKKKKLGTFELGSLVQLRRSVRGKRWATADLLKHLCDGADLWPTKKVAPFIPGRSNGQRYTEELHGKTHEVYPHFSRLARLPVTLGTAAAGRHERR